jgi:predicted RNA-binding protein with PUA-like domain
MTTAKPTTGANGPRRWLLAVDPRVYHWDTLFVKGKEMWRQGGHRPDSLRQLRQMRRGDRALCYHGKPEQSIYALVEVTRDPYPDPQIDESRSYVVDLRAMERLPRQVSLAELKQNPALKSVKFLRNVRLVISPLTEEQYAEILRMAGITSSPGIPLP